jgi:diguanylate cyclase (GGDEF)-like protein
LEADERFEVFRSRALQAGLAAVFTFPVGHGDKRLGALDLYRASPGPLAVDDVEAAQTLADVTAAYLVNAQARADLQDLSDRAQHASLHDSLTGLPNRVLLLERLERAMLRYSRSHKMIAVLFVDLDRFKTVNDRHGHHTGDNLLVAVARRLVGVLRPLDTLARMSGDEFVVLCEDLEHESRAEIVAQRIVNALTTPFVLSGLEVEMSASVGVAFAGRGQHLPEQLLRDADSAMYQVKRNGGANHQVVDLRCDL